MNDPLVTKALRMNDLKERIDVLKSEASALQKEYDAIRNDELPDMMESRDIPRISIGSIGKTLHTVGMLRTTIIEKEEGFQWLRDNGYGDIITETVPWQSLDALVKEQMVEGVEFPNGVFEIRMWDQARLRKG